MAHTHTNNTNSFELRLKIPGNLRGILELIAANGIDRTANDVAFRFVRDGVMKELGSTNLIEMFEKATKLARDADSFSKNHGSKRETSNDELPNAAST